MSFRKLRGQASYGMLTSAITAALCSGAFSTAYAQNNAAQGAVEEIEITGSRILRRDTESNSPIVTVEAADFETQTGLNVESYLNQLPEYNPAASPTTTQQDVQITPVNSVGIASISLRGFGANRSLILVDGHRPTPINALMVTDVNSIPSGLIQRVETITGGASAVYGADAVGGVTNFILKKDFEGMEFDVQYGLTEVGDGDESRISAVFGSNLADGRGNVTIGLERYERKTAFQAERDTYTERWAADNTPGSFIFLQGVNGYACNFNCPNQTAVNTLFGGNPFSPLGANVFRGYNFNPDGTIFVAGSARGEARNKYPTADLQYGKTKALDATDTTGNTIYDALKWNNLEAWVSAPQDRYSVFASGNFDVSDTVTVFASAKFTESRTKTLLQGTNAVGGWEAMIPYNPTTDSPYDTTLIDETNATQIAALLANPAAYANPNFRATGTAGANFPVPLEMALLLNARGNPTDVWQPNWNPENSLPPRNTNNTNEVWQVDFGVNFQLPVRDWTGELYASHGESSTYNVAGGNLSLSRFRALVNAPDYGRGAKISGNSTSIRPNFGAGDITCETGFYDTFFGGDKALSQDCYDAVNAVLQTRTEMKQDIVELNLQGGIVELPAGEMRGAVGYQLRKVNGKFYPDILQSQVSFTDQVIGVYPTGYLDASTRVNDFYAEALVPVVADLAPGIQRLELELGGRYSDYRETSAEWTYKALANWQVVDWLRVRGGYNRATRAPNLGELFLNPQEIFTGGGNFGDPCSVRANAPFGAGGFTGGIDPVISGTETAPALAPGQSQAGADSAHLICQAMMGGAGSVAETQFYTVTNATVQAGGGGFAWVLQQGNPNLQSEKANTWTAGFVMRSPFESPWLANTTLIVDWYKVNIKDAIMTYSIDYANWRCFGTELVTNATEAAAQAATPGCQLVPRDQNTGGALNTTLSYDNQARIATSGFDVALNWMANFADLGLDLPGSVGFNIQGTILDYYRTKQSPALFDVETNWKGSLGPNLPGTNAGAYSYRLFSSISYMMDSWSVALRWRHLPSVWSAGKASQLAIIDNNAAVAADASAGITLGYTPSTEIKTKSYNIFDLSFNWNINETFALRGGITNLFDKDPTHFASTAGRAPGSDISAATVCGSAPGCRAPGGYSVPSVGGPSGGFYDTLGRRFFLGLKASF
ncbi:MAG: TonB-dependent receptor [Gammaproteobacteria bacterium]|nr:TonB-dependent receptor [Gammaproteobacteria bacterium]